MLVIDMDDFGANHIISDQCQSHDCRDQLDKFHYANPNFKVTLFAIPTEMTYELAEWCRANKEWVELAVHGFFHSSNYECEKMTFTEFTQKMLKIESIIDTYFVKGFKAPGWQISDDIYEWLMDRSWWVADQSYNDSRRPLYLPAYVNNNGNFLAYKAIENQPVHELDVKGKHYHTWDCVGNGVYELEEQIINDIKDETEFRFISELLG